MLAGYAFVGGVPGDFFVAARKIRFRFYSATA